MAYTTITRYPRHSAAYRALTAKERLYATLCASLILLLFMLAAALFIGAVGLFTFAFMILGGMELGDSALPFLRAASAFGAFGGFWIGVAAIAGDWKSFKHHIIDPKE